MIGEIAERHNPAICTARSLGMPPLDFKARHEIILPQRLRRGVSDLLAWDVAGAAPMATPAPRAGRAASRSTTR